MMKKLLALLLAGVLALSMSACCCCLPMEDFELPDFDIPDFDLPNVQRPSAENSKPTGDVIIVVPSDPDKENSDPGNDPSGEIQRPTEPERPSEMPTIKPQPSVPDRKEVYRCVLSTWMQTDFGSGTQHVTLKDGMIYRISSINPPSENKDSYIVYNWKSNCAYHVTDGQTGEVELSFMWDEKGNISRIETDEETVDYSYTNFDEIESIHYFDKAGTLMSQVVMEYDSENRPICSITYNQDGFVQDRLEQVYDEHGNLVRYTYWENGYLSCDDVYTYTYDNAGNVEMELCISALDDSFVSKNTYIYNAEGLVEYMYSYEEDGSCNRWYEYQYNGAGLQTQELSYHDGELSASTVTDYDSNGNVVYTADYLHYNGESTLLGEYTFEYETVYLTEAEDRLQTFVDNLIGNWWY